MNSKIKQQKTDVEILNRIDNKLKVLAIGGGTIGTDAFALLKEAIKQFALPENAEILLIMSAKWSKENHDETVQDASYAFDRINSELGTNFTLSVLHDYLPFDCHLQNCPQNDLRTNSQGSLGEINTDKAFGSLDTDNLITMIKRADAFYIGGGDTLRMMEIWQYYKIDQVLIEQVRIGKPIMGVSAGAIASMKWGHSDSMSFRVKNNEDWNYIRVDALGLLPFAITPHYDSRQGPQNKKRAKMFKQMLTEQWTQNSNIHNWVSFGIDNLAAILVKDGIVNGISTKKDAFVHHIFMQGKRCGSEKLDMKVLN